MKRVASRRDRGHAKRPCKLTERPRSLQVAAMPGLRTRRRAGNLKLVARLGRVMSKSCSLLCLLMLAACAAPTGTPERTSAPAAPTASAPVVRRPLPEAPAAPATPPLAGAPLPGVSVPPGLLYVCVTDTNGQRKQVGIEFAPKVHDLCSRHPEMGPCQYERQTCRRNGGRVFAANGEEITLATEAEYDKKVMRVRFRAN